ncbi:MAG: glycosyltransferase family 4 protein [Bacteroidales bacterium]|nr:glycosyltransferase family 4 protein [Bacteroidales bacterium]
MKILLIPSLPIIAKVFFNPLGIVRFFRNLALFRRQLRRVAHTRPDIIYLNTLATVPILMLYRKVKKIVHVHEILQNNNIFNLLINRFSLHYADCLICVSEAVKNNLKKALPGYGPKLHVVNNGLSFNLTEEYAPIKHDKNKVNVALIGRIKPSHKGQLFLLEAISKMDKSVKVLSHFYLVGSVVKGQEYMQSKVEDSISKFGMSNCVEIIPFVKEISSVYKAMDIIVVPSLCEDPFPTTILEGMFWSKPIVATRVGGVPEMIENQATGYIIEKNNAQMLCEKLTFLIQSPELRVKMGNEGRKRFEAFFTEESFSMRFLSLLKSEGIIV